MMPDLITKRSELEARIEGNARKAEEYALKVKELNHDTDDALEKLKAIELVLSMFPEATTKSHTALFPSLEDEANTAGVKTIRQWVLDVLGEKRGTWMRVRQIADRMVELGFAITTDNYVVSVSNACLRLADKGEILVNEEGPRKTFCMP